MSLVNDALKRAKDAHDKQAAPPLRGAPLHTLPSAPGSGSSRGLWLVLILLVVFVGGIVVVGGGYWFFQKSYSRSTPVVAHAVAVNPPPTPGPAAIEPQPVVEPTPPPAAPPAPEIVPAPTVVEVSPAPGAPPQPPPNPTAALKLQGILYSPTKPAAILNGRTVYVGDNIAGMTISAIAPDRITVLHNNQPFVIRMP